MRDYFAGTLPAPGTVCQTDTQMFQNPGNSSGFSGIVFNGRTSGDEGYAQAKRFRDAVRGLRESDFLARRSLLGRFRAALEDGFVRVSLNVSL